MSIVYIAKANIPSTAANSVHVMKISEAFAEMDDAFRLIIPQSDQKEDVEKSFSEYGVKPFEIESISVPRQGLGNRYGFAIKSIWKARKADRVITRDPLVAFLAVVMHKHTVLDLHGDLAHLCGRAYRMIYWKGFRDSKYLHLVMITKGLVEYYRDKYGVPMERMIVLPDGYSAGDFTQVKNSSIAENKQMMVGYCGGFVKGKGLELIHDLTCIDVVNQYNIYGGSAEDAKKSIGKEFPDNVFFGGYVPNKKVPEILSQQDILLLPNQMYQVCKNEDIGQVTSPLKMFEYMASGKAIIASDIPVLREILNNDNSFLVEADKPEKWAETIEFIAKHPEEAARRAEKALLDVKEYTWTKRAEKMLMLCGE